MGGKKGAIGAAGGAVGLSAFSAALGACCGMSWAVALLGVTGAVSLARMAFLLPYAMAGAILLLAVSFWLTYRRPAVCTDGGCKTREPTSPGWFVWIAAILVAGLTALALIPFLRT